MSGYGNLSEIDIQGSKSFFAEFLKDNPKFIPKRVLDCGAGIGRIAKEYLCSAFQKVIFT